MVTLEYTVTFVSFRNISFFYGNFKQNTIVLENPCLNNNQCAFGSTCTANNDASVNYFTCTCNNGCSGTLCNQNCDCRAGGQFGCQNGGVCNNGVCQCATGYTGTLCASCKYIFKYNSSSLK
jgi:hypothetical protein